jgi:uncharacterized membrane protein YqgA involved in biofilm formation
MRRGLLALAGVAALGIGIAVPAVALVVDDEQAVVAQAATATPVASEVSGLDDDAAALALAAGGFLLLGAGSVSIAQRRRWRPVADQRADMEPSRL